MVVYWRFEGLIFLVDPLMSSTHVIDNVSLSPHFLYYDVVCTVCFFTLIGILDF